MVVPIVPVGSLSPDPTAMTKTPFLKFGALALALLSTQPAHAQAGGWTDYGGGTMLRRNEALTQALSGYSWVYVSTYNGGAGGGMAAQHRAIFCGSRSVQLYSESSVSMGAGSAFGNSSSRDSDSGLYEVLEDRAGNTFIHMVLEKNGTTFIHFKLQGAKILTENMTFTRYQQVC